MRNLLLWAQVGVSILLVGAILLQQKGSGLGSALGGDNSNIYSTRRGAEKVLFYSTIVFALAFLAISLVRIRL